MWHQQDNWLAHVSPQLCNAVKSERQRREERGRVFAACQQSKHTGYLHPGRDAREAASTNHSSQYDLVETVSNWWGGRRELILLIAPFVFPRGKAKLPPRAWKEMAGTTRLELATSAVTEWQLVETQWNRTVLTARPWYSKEFFAAIYWTQIGPRYLISPFAERVARRADADR